MCKTTARYTPVTLKPCDLDEGAREVRLSEHEKQGTVAAVDVSIWISFLAENIRSVFNEAQEAVARFAEEVHSLGSVRAEELPPRTLSSLGAAYSM